MVPCICMDSTVDSLQLYLTQRSQSEVLEAMMIMKEEKEEEGVQAEEEGLPGVLLYNVSNHGHEM